MTNRRYRNFSNSAKPEDAALTVENVRRANCKALRGLSQAGATAALRRLGVTVAKGRTMVAAF